MLQIFVTDTLSTHTLSQFIFRFPLVKDHNLIILINAQYFNMVQGVPGLLT